MTFWSYSQHYKIGEDIDIPEGKVYSLRINHDKQEIEVIIVEQRPPQYVAKMAEKGN